MSPSPPLVLESLGLRQQTPEKYFVILTCRKSQRKWEEKQVLNKMKGGNIKELCLPLELEHLNHQSALLSRCAMPPIKLRCFGIKKMIFFIFLDLLISFGPTESNHRNRNSWVFAVHFMRETVEIY